MQLGRLDIILLSLSLLVSVLIGLYHGIIGIKQTSMDYLLGGRMMKPIPLAMSLTVGTVSAISIMGNAGEMYAHGTQLWVMDFGMAIGMYAVAKLFIPILYPLQMISIYQYIESRFKSTWLRKSTVVLTLGGAYIFIGFLLYPPSAFLKSLTGLGIEINIVITGLICSLYSSFGGVKAVVYTDVLQSLIMISGSLAIVIHGSANIGGLGNVWDIAYHHNRIEFFNFDFNPFQRHSFWLVIIYGFFFSLSTYGVNQSQTQRAFSSGSIKDSQKVIYYAIVGLFLLRGLINLSGIVIFANYAECDPLTANENESKPRNNIEIVVIYVMTHLTKSNFPGLAGLFVASVYSAVLSSVSTQLNSMTALVWEDLLKDIPFFKSANEIAKTRYQKVLVMLTGFIGILAGIIVSTIRSYLTLLFQITGSLWGPMVGLFVVAIFLPWVKVKGASIGFLLSILISGIIVAGQIWSQPEAKYLPMSRDGCTSTNLTEIALNSNITSFNGTEDVNTSNETILSNQTLRQYRFAEGENIGIGIFGLSYCLNYCWGVISCLIISILCTAMITGPNLPKNVDENLIHPFMWQIFTTGMKKTFLKRFRKELPKKSNYSKKDLNSKGSSKEEEMVSLEKH